MLRSGLLALVVVLGATAANAQSRFVPYSGDLRLAGTDFSGTVGMTAVLYESMGSTTARGSATLPNVVVSSGRFAESFGPFPDSAFDYPELWMELTVDGELLGRTRLLAAPLAVRGEVGKAFKAGATSVTSLSSSGSVSGTSVSSSGLVSGATVSSSGSVSGGTLSISGAASTGSLTANGTVNALDIGEMGYSATWLGIRHGALNGPDDYALIQSSVGETLLNAKGGQAIGFRSGNTNRMWMTAGGQLGIGTTNPGAQLEVNGGGATSIQLRNSSGSPWALRILNESNTTYEGGLYISNAGFLEMTNRVSGAGAWARLDSNGNWSTTSDKRAKRDIASADGLLDRVRSLQPVTYRMKNADPVDDERQLGFLAQDVRPLFPSLVKGDDMLTLNYAGLSTVAIGAVKELEHEHDSRLDALEAENKALRDDLATMRAELARLAAAGRFSPAARGAP